MKTIVLNEIFTISRNKFLIRKTDIATKLSITSQYQKLDLISFIDNPFPQSATRWIIYVTLRSAISLVTVRHLIWTWFHVCMCISAWLGITIRNGRVIISPLLFSHLKFALNRKVFVIWHPVLASGTGIRYFLLRENSDVAANKCRYRIKAFASLIYPQHPFTYCLRKYR